MAGISAKPSSAAVSLTPDVPTGTSGPGMSIAMASARASRSKDPDAVVASCASTAGATASTDPVSFPSVRVSTWSGAAPATPGIATTSSMSRARESGRPVVTWTGAPARSSLVWANESDQVVA